MFCSVNNLNRFNPRYSKKCQEDPDDPDCKKSSWTLSGIPNGKY